MSESKMPKELRVARVIRKLDDNIARSRQSTLEWQDVKRAYLRMLAVEMP